MKYRRIFAICTLSCLALSGCGSGSSVSEPLEDAESTECVIEEPENVASLSFDNFDKVTVKTKSGSETISAEDSDTYALPELTSDEITFVSDDKSEDGVTKYIGVSFNDLSYSLSADDFDSAKISDASAELTNVTGMYVLQITSADGIVLDDTHSVAIVSLSGDVSDGTAGSIKMNWSGDTVTLSSDSSGSASFSVSVVDSDTGAYNCYIADVSLDEPYQMSYADIVASLPEAVD